MQYIFKYTRWSDAEFAKQICVAKITFKNYIRDPNFMPERRKKQFEDLYAEVYRLVQEAKTKRKK